MKRTIPCPFGGHAGLRLARVKATGAKILSTATTVEEARWLEERGCDAIIAQGAEAGGHRGMFLTENVDTQIGTMALVPQIVDAVSVPVIAAGGIADATVLTNVFTGRPARGILNRIVRELGPMSDSVPVFPLAGGALAPLRAQSEPKGQATSCRCGRVRRSSSPSSSRSAN